MATPVDFRPSVANAIDIVAQSRGASAAEILGAAQIKRILKPRREAIYVAKEATGKSLSEIGRNLNRDHTTIIHAISRVEAEMKVDEEYADEMKRLVAMARTMKAEAVGTASELDLSPSVKHLVDVMRQESERISALMVTHFAKATRDLGATLKAGKAPTPAADARSKASQPLSMGPGLIRAAELDLLFAAWRGLENARFSSAEGGARARLEEEVKKLARRLGK